MSKEMREQINKVKNYKQFLTENRNSQIGELRDYLKSNCRNWEYDSDNYDDTVSLTNYLQQRFSDLSFDEIFNIAKDWTGYEESVE
jgi:hypothetical protein